MLKRKLSKKAEKFLSNIPDKHFEQIANKIDDLQKEKKDLPITNLKGNEDLKKISAGEYRIIFHIDEDTLYIDAIGKRNDGEIYRGY